MVLLTHSFAMWIVLQTLHVTSFYNEVMKAQTITCSSETTEVTEFSLWNSPTSCSYPTTPAWSHTLSLILSCCRSMNDTLWHMHSRPRVDSERSIHIPSKMKTKI
jgi:hypothetical protein